jgi:D-xylose transport system permease protein
MTKSTIVVEDGDKKDALDEGSLVRFYRALVATDIGSFAVLFGLVLIIAIFQLANHNFLSPLNITNLMSQISSIGILSVGIVLILLIGEIDLSIGAVSGFTAAIMTVLLINYHIPSIAAILIAILCGLIIGAVQGFLFSKIHIPAFIVTLAGLLIWQGGQIYILGDTGTLNLRDPIIIGIANALVPPGLGWILGIIAILIIIFGSFRARNERLKAGLTTEPFSIIITRLALMSIVILGAIALMNIDRNPRAGGQPVRGVPMAVIFLIGFVLIFYLITHYTVFGRHIYLVGGNAEAARRAAIDVDRLRIIVFSLCSGLAACGGILAASRLYAINMASGSGDVLLNSIAAAVIGGTSLFGGRGSTWSALLGGLIIGSIANGMDLLNFSSAIKYMVTGLVLLLAVIIDSVSRTRRQRFGRG